MKNSGVIQTVINTRERLISSDINNLQYMQSAHVQQSFRRLMSDRYETVTGSSGDPQAGVSTPFTADGNYPLVAEVLGGLMVLPGTTSCLVQEGTLSCIKSAIPPNPNDCIYSYVDDPGVQLSGVLAFTPNATSSIRVDIVECTPDVTVLTIENRDVFDPITGLFVPTPVVKTSAARLSYRIRSGVAGGGFPGFANDYLPLAVLVHPPGTTSFADVTFYDVRPLVADRWKGPFAIDELQYGVGNTFHQISYGVDVTGAVATVFGAYNLDGEGFQPQVQGKSYGRCCGKIYRSVPGGANYTDFIATSTDNHASGLAITNDTWYYVVALFPYGLPRWCRYTTTNVNGQRRPQPQRGILTLTVLTPDNGGVVSSVPLPIGMGMGDTHGGRLVAVLRTDGASAFVRMYSDTKGNVRFSDSGNLNGLLLASQGSPNFGPTGFRVTLDSTLMRPWMSSMLINQGAFAALGSTGSLECTTFTMDGVQRGGAVNYTSYGLIAVGAAANYAQSYEVPLANGTKGIGQVASMQTEYTSSAGSITMTSYRLWMLGFSIGW